VQVLASDITTQVTSSWMVLLISLAQV